MSRADLQDADESDAAVSALHEVLDFCSGHVAHETEFVHTAVEARRPGSAALSKLTILSTRRISPSCASYPSRFSPRRGCTTRRARWNAPQRIPVRCIGNSLEHREVKESRNNAALQSAYSSVELIDLHHRQPATMHAAQRREWTAGGAGSNRQAALQKSSLLGVNQRWVCIGHMNDVRTTIARY